MPTATRSLPSAYNHKHGVSALSRNFATWTLQAPQPLCQRHTAWHSPALLAARTCFLRPAAAQRPPP